MQKPNKPKYKIEPSSLEKGIYLVVEIEANKPICAGAHNICVYIATRLNETNDDLQTIIDEINSGNLKWKEVPRELYKLKSLFRKN